MSGSCPMIFAWDGRKFEFISDVLGVAPLGASSGDGDYFPVNDNEYVADPERSCCGHTMDATRFASPRNCTKSPTSIRCG